ncbi:MAG: glutamate mutase L [Candidatus Rokubacteria bacterium]|nr:glutamate mutase L [Candidatus Rokubacteria bacterium]
MPAVFLIDFGSTFTKIVAVDPAAPRVLARVQAPSTVDTDVRVGLDAALGELRTALGTPAVAAGRFMASSSAAGGLRLAALGLVPELTAEAARRAALGAGARVLRVFAHRLNSREAAALEALAPEIVLLAGGTDGGNSEVVRHNAAALARTSLTCPIVYAGNKDATDEVEALLRAGGKDVVVTENVLPEIGRLNVEPVRDAVRELFMRRIVEAKGMHRVRPMVGDVLMPTPMAVLLAAVLLAHGVPGEAGVGDVVVVDVGGATTDVHSAASGTPSDPTWVVRGLPEPFAKRTVEGDLGLRVNAGSVLEAAGGERLASLASLPAARVTTMVAQLARETERVPTTRDEHALDEALARTAVSIAVGRHAGTVETVYGIAATPVQVVRGKDLTRVGVVVGTGGIFAHGAAPRRVLEGALVDATSPFSLRPRDARLLVDRSYLLYAMGLLAGDDPRAALRLMKRHLVDA